MSMNSPRTASTGLTLIEVLIAIAVIGITFASLAALQISNLRVTTDAQRDTNLLEEAIDVFESVKVDIESDFATYNDCNPCTFTRSGADVVVSGAPTFGGTVQNGLVEVLVTVTADSGETREFRQILSCIDAANPPSVRDPGECAE